MKIGVFTSWGSQVGSSNARQTAANRVNRPQRLGRGLINSCVAEVHTRLSAGSGGGANGSG